LDFETLMRQKGKDYCYIMHLSYDGRERERLWEYARKNKLIGLDQPSIVTDDWPKVRSNVVREKLLGPIWIKQYDTICGMKRGDIVVVLEGWHSWLGIAEVQDDEHRYLQGLNVLNNPTTGFFDHVRSVKWEAEYKYGNHDRLPEPIKSFTNTLFKVRKGTKRWELLAGISW